SRLRCFNASGSARAFQDIGACSQIIGQKCPLRRSLAGRQFPQQSAATGSDRAWNRDELPLGAPGGRWALSAFEDRNGNGVLDTGLFGPKEPSGFWHPFTGHHKPRFEEVAFVIDQDRKSTRLNSSHLVISYAVFCLK